MKKYGTGILTGVFLLACSCGIGGSAQDAYENGVKLAQEGNVKKAFKFFKSAAKNAPDSGRYYFAAAQTAPDQNTAFMYTKFAWEKGLKNRAVFTALLRLSFHVDKEKKLEYALSLFGELPDSVATDNFKGDLYFDFGSYDKAYTLWNSEFIKTGKSVYCSKIARALVKQGKIDQAVEFLYKCKDDKVLDADGYSNLASLLAMQYKFKEVDRLFAEVSASNVYDDMLRLEQATYLIFNGRGKEAEALLNRPAGPGAPKVKAMINHRIHTLRILQSLMAGEKEKVKSLLAKTPPDTVFKEKGKNVFTAIEAFLNGDTASFSILQKACEKMPPDPVTTVFWARSAMQKKMYKEAQAIYNRLLQ